MTLKQANEFLKKCPLKRGNPVTKADYNTAWDDVESCREGVQHERGATKHNNQYSLKQAEDNLDYANKRFEAIATILGYTYNMCR